MDYVHSFLLFLHIVVLLLACRIFSFEALLISTSVCLFVSKDDLYNVPVPSVWLGFVRPSVGSNCSSCCSCWSICSCTSSFLRHQRSSLTGDRYQARCPCPLGLFVSKAISGWSVLKDTTAVLLTFQYHLIVPLMPFRVVTCFLPCVSTFEENSCNVRIPALQWPSYMNALVWLIKPTAVFNILEPIELR